MFARSATRFVARKLPRVITRQISIKATYTSSFPATLHHYRPSSKFLLYDIKEKDSRPHDLFDDGVIVNDKGLVEPSLIRPDDFACTGAVMYPNTFYFQEMIRQYYDEMLDLEDEGVEVETPFLFTVPKGTPIPSSLMLANIATAHFSLQPSVGMPLKDLNQRLDEFYAQYAVKQTADEWFDEHAYPDAIPDDLDSKWMAL